MIRVDKLFIYLKAGWVRRYIKGLDDHWADLVDKYLGLDITNRTLLLERGSEHPKLKAIIEENLPCLSTIFESYKIVQKEFQENREGDDGRWENSPVFFNPIITRNVFPNLVRKFSEYKN